MNMHPAAKTAEQDARRDQREIRWGGDPGTRQALRTEIAERTAANVVVIGAEKKRTKHEYGLKYRKWSGEELAPDAEPRIINGFVPFTYAAAIAVALLDAGVSGIIGAATFNLSRAAAALTGVVLALVLTVIFKGICGHLAAHFEDRPRKALGLLDRALVAFAVPWTLCFFGALFIGRFGSGSPLVDTIFNGLITALATLSPLLSAVLLVCAEIRGWDRGPVRLYRKLEEIEGKLAALLSRCKPREEEEEGPAGGAPKSGKPGGPTARAAAVFLFVIGLASVCRAGEVGQMWVDRSPSPGATAIAQGLDSALALLPQIARETRVSQVEVYGFAGDAFDAAPVGKPLQLPPFAPPVCTAGQKKSDRGTIFKTPSEDPCAAKTEDARKQYDQAQTDELVRGRKEVMIHIPSDRGRTCIIDLLARFAMPGARPAPFALIITDGVETCDPSSKEILPSPPAGADVVMVLVSGKTGDSRIGQRRHFLELKRTWEQRAPWLKAVVPRSGLSAELFGRSRPTVQKLK